MEARRVRERAAELMRRQAFRSLAHTAGFQSQAEFLQIHLRPGSEFLQIQLRLAGEG
jgi:hypothetical protein